MTPLAALALEYAVSQNGVREVPPGSNRGPDVEKFQRAVGEWAVGKAYCASFIVWAVKSAMRELGQLANPIPMVAGAVMMYTTASQSAKRSAPQAGCTFHVDHGHGNGTGHTGFVIAVAGPTLVTVEANTNPGGSREGDGVYLRTRKAAEVNLGYLVF